MRTERYYQLEAKVRRNLDDCGIKLDLHCPCDRAILTECGLTPEEALEFLSLFDADEYDCQDDTRRAAVARW